MASSTHPIEAGGYSRKDYPSLTALTNDVRENVNPLGAQIRQAYPRVTYWRYALNGETYDHVIEPTAPSFFDLVAQAPSELLKVLPGLSDQAQAVLFQPGTAPKEYVPETLLDASSLVDRIKNGQVSAEAVVEASVARIALAQEALGAYTHLIADQARARAKALDAKRTRGEVLGPLHGLPVTIKAHIALQGTLSTRCFVVDALRKDEVVDPSLSDAHLIDSRGIGDPFPPYDGLSVRVLEQAGAIIVGKTTMPTTIMQLDTRSAGFGQTLNAHNLGLSPGGSSGGEGSSVSAGASALGLGTDIGGSVRQPAAMSGLWGFRPTTDRLPTSGVRTNSPGNIGVGAVSGPLARSLRDVQLYMRTLLSPQAIDGNKGVWDIDNELQLRPWSETDGLPPNPTFEPSWLTEAARSYRAKHGKKTKLVIGVQKHDGVVLPQPPIRRALAHVAEQLKAFSHTPQGSWLGVKELAQPLGNHKYSWDLIRSLYFQDGAQRLKALIAAGQEPPIPLVEFIFSEPFVPKEPTNALEVFDKRAEREEYKTAYWKAWDQAGIDVLLCPATTSVAERPQTAYYWGYTSHWNLLDYSALVFPSGIKANAEQDQAFDEAERKSGEVPRSLGPEDERVAQEYQKYQHAFEGAPAGLQLVAKRGLDEQLIKAAEVVDFVALQPKSES